LDELRVVQRILSGPVPIRTNYGSAATNTQAVGDHEPDLLTNHFPRYGFIPTGISDILPRMVNKVTLVGRLGKDPETRYTSGGQAVANFSLATDETFKDRSGEKQKRTEWHRIVMWGKLAEIAQQYLKKGALVYLEGRIQSRQWEDKRDGQKKTSYEIVADTMKMLGGRGEGAAAGAGAGAGGSSSRGRAADSDFDAGPMPEEHSSGGGGSSEIGDEDIPF
jgi:single-strand DNA-binding protein